MARLWHCQDGACHLNKSQPYALHNKLTSTMQAHAALLRRHPKSTAAVSRVLAASSGSILSKSSSPLLSDRHHVHYLKRSRPFQCYSYSSSSLPSWTCSSLVTKTCSVNNNISSQPISSRSHCYSTLPLSSSSVYNALSSASSNNTPPTPAPTTTLQKRTKVFVSKHNQTLNLTPHQITDYLTTQLPHLDNHSSSSDFRITSSHVIIRECPFCTKPTNNKADNLYKLYIALGGGAYFCHRCGVNGSWYDLKAALGGFRVEGANANSGGNNGGGIHYHHGQNGHHNNNQYGSNAQYSNPYGNNTQHQQKPKPLPMPHPKLNSLHSTSLFSPQNIDAMEYLTKERGLTKAVLRKYGVGCAVYKFPSNRPMKGHNGDGEKKRMEYVSSTCVTFPWLMRQSEVVEQEELRGAEYVWKRNENNGNNDSSGEDSEDGGGTEEQNEKEKQRQRELELESKRRMEAAAAALEEERKKKKTKSRSEMTALERYYAKKERRSRNSNKTNADVNSYEDADENNDNDGMDQFQFTPIPPPQQQPLQALQQLTPDEIESLHGPYTTRRIKVRSIHQKSWQRLDPPGGGMGLFGWHTIPHDATEIIVTEGEFDAMAVYQATGRPTVSLPNGCRSLPMEVLVLLEKFDTVYLWMDNDGPGREGAEMFARKLGVERCLLVQPSGKRGWNGGNNSREYEDEIEEDVVSSLNVDNGPPPPPKDANEALLQGWDINELLNEASELPHERILKFSDLRDQVRSE